MPRAQPLPVHLAGTAFRVADSGLARSRLRASDLLVPAWGLRTTESLNVDSLTRAWMLRLPWYAFFARETAARVLGIPLPLRLQDDRIHVRVRARRRRVDASGITAHHCTLSPGDVIERAGIRVTSVERTWVDLASVLTLPELVAAGDFVLSRKHPLSTRSRLAAAVEQYTGRRGLKNLRLALTLLSESADSPPESEVRIALLRAGLPAPEINAPVFSPHGVFVAQPDLSWPRFRTAMDYECTI